MENISNVKAKKVFSARLKLVAVAICVFIALVTYVIFKAVDNPPFTPSLFSFALFFGVFGVAYLAISLLEKNVFSYFLAILSLAISLLFVLILSPIKWYVIIVIVLGFLVIAIFLGLAFGTKGLVVVAKNESSDYKNYRQRRAEKEQKEGEEE